MAAPLLIAMAGIGTAINAYSVWKQGQEKAESLLESAAMKEDNAREVIRRNDINNGLIFSEGQRFLGNQIAGIAASGAGGATSSAQYEETASLVAGEIRRNSEVAQWEARMSLLEASSMRRSASQIQSGSKLAALGTLFSGAAKTWDASPAGYSGQDVPKPNYGGQTVSALGD